MADIFISYSRSDRERCSAIRKALEDLKVSVWSDTGIGAGSSFDREIEREIEACTALLVLWSGQSVDSDWVRNEARTGKERSGLVAVQLEPCQLPLEFRSVQAEVLPDGAQGTAHATWLGILSRIGELTGRPGLAEYARICTEGSLDDWKRWLARHPDDPLAPDAIDGIVERAMPDMRQQLASERTKRAALEAELAEHVDASRARSTEITTNARELVRLRGELEDTRNGLREAETELSRFRAASGSNSGFDDGGLAGLGIVLGHRLALYICALLWFVAIWFCWEPLSQLMNGRGALADVFWICFGIAALFVPAVIITMKILRKRSALARETEGLALPD
ncbi:toll/interleukin-1 receptor domain-containing protein [Novosphingobium mangrovi (ex Huang et al. 2023)]|uniref:Toll/interleukin-1 receptor domain-containing protein n=1 Tax=Novosphingobium mangrovi (ex Huang et al. 2023) TaxID=2976432 RepID=A0ABT2I9F5_9SPHN|nr:toll/interleukin-1 receptor domain-containing protein [Novosphingobium mangrovi (ex Huang et al. 2023)]MCT2401453.1 toll/interleukin-1 receptor domain-containing protein [Novosphingobium mangrovi (ex Huang et al. 2023)]